MKQSLEKADGSRRAALLLKVIQLAEQYSKETIAFDAVAWVIRATHADAASVNETPQTRAIAILLRDHIESDKLGLSCYELRFAFTKESELFLRTVSKMSPHKEVKGIACLALAEFLNNRVEMLDVVEAGPEGLSHFEPLFGKDYLHELRSKRVAFAKEAEQLFQQATDEYGDVPHRSGSTVGYLAGGMLFEIRHLTVGKEAPEIEGLDQHGKKLKLSDYRGKVVLLDFWSLH